MQEPIVVRQGLWVALLAAGQFIAPPLLVVVSLYISGLSHGLSFESQYLSLALIAGALSLVIQRLPAELAAQSGTRDPGVVLSVLSSWVALVVMLLLASLLIVTSCAPAAGTTPSAGAPGSAGAASPPAPPRSPSDRPAPSGG